jgi:hypothetical protein
MARLLLVVMLSLLAAACARFPGFPPNETGILSYDWVPADPRPAPEPLYCYSTLARPECFKAPLPDRPPLGHYGAAPSYGAPGNVNIGSTPTAMIQPASAPASTSARAPEEPPPVPVMPVERAPQPLAPPPAHPQSDSQPKS